MTLTEFVLARVAEREALARTAKTPVEVLADEGLIYGKDSRGHWCVGYHGDSKVDDVVEVLAEAMNDPAAVLADCEAQRWVVQEAARAEAPGSCYGWEEGYAEGEWSMAQAVLRLMALRHADHPDYDESWRP